MSKNDLPAEAPRRLFDFVGSEGVNESERILAKLCKRSFLRLWSQTNVFTDEGFKDGKGGTKELCDALVIFGDDVIIFSDKDIKFQTDRELKIAWPRWYRRAILESCKQLHGAKSWLTRFPERAFLDDKCARKLPIAVPRGPGTRFHLIAVTRGSREAAIAHRGGDDMGSLSIDSSVEHNAHLEQPFVIGLPEPKKAFVHVLDEVSIELVMKELDTAVDFLDYLKAREDLLCRRGSRVMAPGEEALLAAYLGTMNKAETRHVFFDLGPEDGLPDLVVFDESNYSNLRDDPGYRRKKQADRISYEWDALIDRFLEYGDPGIHPVPIDQTSAETEEGLRLLAAESRFRRRQLATCFIGALKRVEPGMRMGRVLNPQAEGETVFVFLVMPLRKEKDYKEYRDNRIAMLHAYVQTARLKAPLGKIFVGIAFDNPYKSYEGGSEDLLVLRKNSWTAEELVELEKKCEELDLWKTSRVEWSRYRQDEFPLDSQWPPIESMPRDEAVRHTVVHDNGVKRKAKKRRKKMQQESKRKNRRKAR